MVPIEKMVPVLMLLPGTFGVVIGSVHFLMSGCLILLCTPIFIPSFISFLNMRSNEHMISELERACFLSVVFAATGGIGSTATIIFR